MKKQNALLSCCILLAFAGTGEAQRVSQPLTIPENAAVLTVLEWYAGLVRTGPGGPAHLALPGLTSSETVVRGPYGWAYHRAEQRAIRYAAADLDRISERAASAVTVCDAIPVPGGCSVPPTWVWLEAGAPAADGEEFVVPLLAARRHPRSGDVHYNTYEVTVACIDGAWTVRTFKHTGTGSGVGQRLQAVEQ